MEPEPTSIPGRTESTRSMGSTESMGSMGSPGSPPARWAVAEVRLVLGPAPTVGDLLAALVELMTGTGVEPHDVHFDEVPEGRRLLAACRLRPAGGDVAAPLAALLAEPVPARL